MVKIFFSRLLGQKQDFALGLTCPRPGSCSSVSTPGHAGESSQTRLHVWGTHKVLALSQVVVTHSSFTATLW